MRTWGLSEILQQKMAEEGLTYRELAAKIGLPLCSTWRFLNGRGGLNISSIEKLMAHYGLAVVELPARRSRRGKAKVAEPGGQRRS